MATACSEAVSIKTEAAISGKLLLDDDDKMTYVNEISESQLDPEWIEERFRVDRKKLEQLLQGDNDEDNSSANEFFTKIMRETETQIVWPSKLKVGAKSKKDPHIKVYGKQEAVANAREKVMTVLDTKSHRITLKMDVAHTEHSHVIGKGGCNIKGIMVSTGCHIHFPDSNRNSVNEKSNQVSIAGTLTGVEKARVSIRELLPLVVMFDIPNTGLLQTSPDATSTAVFQIQHIYKVLVTFKQRPRSSVIKVVVRGSVSQTKSVKEAVVLLMEHFCGSNSSFSIPVTTQLEIAPQHHLFMMGRGGSNIKAIMQQTGASIHFPDPSTVQRQRRGTVVLSGQIESIIVAREQLMGCLPLVLMFDVKDDVNIDQGRINVIMERLDVFISVKPKARQTCKSVIVKSIERNASNMYEARKFIMGLNDLSSAFVHPLSYSVQTTTPLSMTLPSNDLTLQSVTPGLAGLMPNGLPHPALSNLFQRPLNNNNHFHILPKDCEQGDAMSKNFDADSELSITPSELSVAMDLPLGEGILVSEPHRTSPDETTIRDSDNKIWSPQSLASTINMSSLHNFSGLVDVTTSDVTSLINEFPECDADLHNVESAFKSLCGEDKNDVTHSHHSSLDSLASNLSSTPSLSNVSNLFGNSLFAATFDYEKKKLQATKAMQKKPNAESSRVPTDYWSGLGFSKSMPDAAIRDRFQKQGILHPDAAAAAVAVPYMAAILDPGSYSPSSLTSSASSSCRNSESNLVSAEKDVSNDCSNPLRKAVLNFSNSIHMEASRFPKTNSRSVPPGFEPKLSDLAELFSKIGLGKYIDLFQQQEVDLTTFLSLTDQDLKELGIATFGARRKMLLTIADLNKQRQAWSSSRLPETSNLSNIKYNTEPDATRITDANVTITTLPVPDITPW